MVISIGLLRAGTDPAGYYLSRQASCPADYYLGAEQAGRWLGSGAEALGLSGRLDQEGGETLRALLAGCSPDGQQLVGQVLRADPRGLLAARDLVEAVRTRSEAEHVPVLRVFPGLAERAAFVRLAAQVDGHRRGRAPSLGPARALRIAQAAGLDVREVYRDDRYTVAARFAVRRVDVRRPGVDVAVSAPKSVSALFALGDPQVAAEVIDAHRAAVGEALDYLESVASHGLRGHQGDGQRAERIGTDGLIVAAFEHRTSRAGDPQLHTHLVVPNLLHGADGKWSAIDSRALHRHALTASYLYHAALRGQLTQRLGVAWTTTEKGVAEIHGIPADLMHTFSTRRRQILQAMRERGVRGPDAAQAACLATRPAKPSGEPETTLRERWAVKARDAGHHPDRVVAAALGRIRPPLAPSIDGLARHLLGPDGLTSQATGFDRRDLLQALCQALPTGLPVGRAEVEAVADQVLGHRDAVRLATRTEDGPRWSTTELLGVERAALGVAQQLWTTRDRDVGADNIVASATGKTLSAEQQHVVAGLAAASGLAVVVGPAGTGKTAVLAAAGRAWTDQGRRVTGAAVAAVTARRLEHASGIRSTSLTRLLGAARRLDPATGRDVGLPRGGVLVVDEASMVDTRTLAMLLARTRAANATLVLVGDPAQLPEIGAGGLFIALARHQDTLRLTDNRRQRELWERRALADLRAGDPDAAVAAYAEHGRVHIAPADELPDRIVDDYIRILKTQPAVTGPMAGAEAHVVMLAVRRVDVAHLNDTTRARLLAAGRLGSHAVTAGHGDKAREYRAGDRVMVTANDHRLGLLNGTRAAVTAVDPQHQRLTLATDEQQVVTVPVDWTERHLDHGYAMTCHKAQGSTVDTALLYGAGALTRESGYVALSRGRTENHVYVPETADDAEVHVEDEHLDQLAARLAIRHMQTLATRQLPSREADRWRSPSERDRSYRQAEGISR